MKILRIDQLREADRVSIEKENIAAVELMERAASKCTDFIAEHYSSATRFLIFCGSGNNGGDGICIARQLKMLGFSSEIFLLDCQPNSLANDAQIQLEKAKKQGVSFRELTKIADFPEIYKGDIIIDAIFGSGLNRTPENLAAEVIKLINNSNTYTISVDLPSGLFADEHSHHKHIVEADIVLSFQCPKLAFFFAENQRYVKSFQILDIGLDDEYLDDVACNKFLLMPEDIFAMYRPRPRFSHKGHFGHAFLMAGSEGKVGAAVLAAKACLRSGAGLVSVHSTASCIRALQHSIPEVMTSCDENETHISSLPKLTPYSCFGAGPGLGTHPETANQLKRLIQEAQSPMLFDADAINILAENKTWLSFIPTNSIFTPHLKEFERLTEKTQDDFHRHELQLAFSKKYNCVVVLKGAYSCITTANGNAYFNPTGNPGMATAGSGDVLSGLILGLVSQGYPPFTATALAVYLHGLAGDLYSEDFAEESLIASDLLHYFGLALKKIRD